MRLVGRREKMEAIVNAALQSGAQHQRAAITLGPVLFNWQSDRWRDFYFRIADEAPVDAVYLGEAVCSKRVPLFDDSYDAVVERLVAAGKTVIWSSLSEVVTKADRDLIEQICQKPNVAIEANDGAALAYLRGRAHHIGPFMNVYNERTAAFLAGRGAVNFCLPPELPAMAIATLCGAMRDLAVTVEVQVFGRQSLALSARCYHARALCRTKDSCRFCCEQDPDGMVLKSVDGRPILAVNGIQTLSYPYLNLIRELPALQMMGVSRFRLSPHGIDMVEAAAAFRGVADGVLSIEEGASRLDAIKPDAPFANGFYYGEAGHRWHAMAGST
jgi:collagenase-like PrtC family protease